MDHVDWTTTGALGDRYVLRTRVGSGRTTTVYVADDVRLERQVAVKLLHPQPDADGFARFAAEAQVLGGLSHPGLVTVYDANLDTDRPYLVMRLVDGEKLATYAAREALEPAAVAQLGAQLADVLAFVHERGVVHGDLDASNVLIDQQGTGHLTGFGADRGLGRPSGDVYSLGMTIAEYLPFDLGPEWRMVLTVMTDRDPDARPDALRCGELLRNVASGVTNEFPLPDLGMDLDAEPDDTEPAEHVPQADRRRRAFTGLAGIGLAATALAVAVATTVNSGTPSEPAGEQQNPPGEQQQPDDTRANPPAQTYPRGDAPQPARQEPAKPDKRKPAKPAPPRSTTQPPDGERPGGPGNGPGNGNGNGGRDDDDRGGGLIGIIIGGLG